MTRRPKALVGAAMLVAVVASTQVNARQKNRNIPENSFDQHAVVYDTAPRTERRDVRSRVRSSASLGVQGDPRPHRWCAWWLRRELGVPKSAFPKWSYNIARSFKYVGTPASGPAVGVVVVWPRHVGIITRRTSTGWVVKSGNDDGAVRERERPLKGVIAYRWVNRVASKARRPVVASLPPQRPRKSQSRVLQNPAPWTSTAAYVEPDFEYAIQPQPVRPEPITWGARTDIFRRYVESKDVVVLPHTSLSCSDGQPFPSGLRRLLNDAASHFGRTAYVNSGYRTPERNRRVGGARNSQHMKCRAVDFRVAGVGIADLRRWVMANLSRYGIGGLGMYRTHIHADARPLTKATKLVTWTGGQKKRVRYAKHRKPSRYASAG